ncbi:DNA-binding response regulator [Cohnella sp. CIP 111063]|uniref:response regulator transcription factor n=1 Tax=unclassified Cohnella TaxID=2636738 RepID=UPI000B8C0D2B|nr:MULTISPECIES: response regulator transcription factor [unclassified Cohnella]OXS54963.1 DNA-binding response regulator [Cohnella sp. CIP 111063]PRX65107.1 DNA-binding response OmpR family regulator [Cohnella sp. SGD-V74]
MKTILVIEDETKIREVITSYLEHAGYRVIGAESGETGYNIIQQFPLDLILLDLMLPDISGEELCKRIRANHSIPIIMLTAKSSKTQQINGLEIGADDYIVKPFDPRELIVRIRTVMRRAHDDGLLADRIESANGEMTIDSLKQQVLLNGEPINLTPVEIKLLFVLAKHPNRIFDREQLIEKVHSLDFEGDSRTIDQHIKNIRQKIEEDPKNPIYIQTVYGKGYRFTGGQIK